MPSKRPKAKVKTAAKNKALTIDTMLIEKRKFKPKPEFVKQANFHSSVEYDQAQSNPTRFWAKMAGELVWKKRWNKVLEYKAPDAKWFVGGKLNITETCLDQHVNNPGAESYDNFSDLSRYQ